MRVVRRSAAASLDEARLPPDALIDEARDLRGRFPRAGLRALSLVTLRPQLHVALESLQVTGSFKVRGALLALDRLLRAHLAAGKTGPLVVVAASAGNHGAGVAYAAKHLGVEAHVVVPRGAPRAKVKKIEAAGAHVLEASSPGYDAAEAEALALADKRGVPFVSPYDDDAVLAGNGASLAFEIAGALGRVPAEVYCPLGGGGLATGLACGLRRLGASRVVPVQSEASCAFAQSLERGRAVTELPPATTLAEGLEGGISERAFARAQAVLDRAVVVTEPEIVQAMRFAFHELGLTVEGSAAVALVPVLAPSFEAPDGDVVVVLTGRNIDADRLARVLVE